MLMRVDMVYHYPIWAVSFLVVGLSVLGAVLVELVARRILPLDARRQNNDVAAAMFSVIGVTFAVLLAFVAMLTFEGYSNAKVTAANEAAACLDVASAVAGLPEPARSSARHGLASYLSDVIEGEWPAQAAGHPENSAAGPLRELNAIAAGFRPGGAAGRPGALEGSQPVVLRCSER